MAKKKPPQTKPIRKTWYSTRWWLKISIKVQQLSQISQTESEESWCPEEAMLKLTYRTELVWHSCGPKLWQLHTFLLNLHAHVSMSRPYTKDWNQTLVPVQGVGPLRRRSGDLHTIDWVSIVYHSAMKIWIPASIIDWCISDITLSALEVVPVYSHPVVILNSLPKAVLLPKNACPERWVRTEFEKPNGISPYRTTPWPVQSPMKGSISVHFPVNDNSLMKSCCNSAQRLRLIIT